MNAFSSDVDYQWKASGYGKIEKMINETDKDFDILFVTDLNYNEEQLRLLGALKTPSNRIIYLDHHLYDYPIQDICNELGIILRHDTTKCGSRITLDFLTNSKKNLSHLDELNRITNIYDLWKKEDKDFVKLAHPLNDLFWEYSAYKFIEKFKSGYHLDTEDNEVLIKKNIERQTALKDSFENKSIINEEQNILMIMDTNLNFKNDFTIFYPEYDVYLILGNIEKTTCHFSVRITDKIKLTVLELYSIMKENLSWELKCGGHEKAGGLEINQSDIPEFMQCFNDSVTKWRDSL